MSWFDKRDIEIEAAKRSARDDAFPSEGQDKDYWFAIYMLLNQSATCPLDGDTILTAALATHEATIKSLLERIERLEG
jgi:hypothetical protein